MRAGLRLRFEISAYTPLPDAQSMYAIPTHCIPTHKAYMHLTLFSCNYVVTNWMIQLIRFVALTLVFLLLLLSLFSIFLVLSVNMAAAMCDNT